METCAKLTISSVLIGCLLAVMTTARIEAQTVERQPRDEQAEVLNAVLSAREVVRDSARVDACSVFRALGSDPGFATRFPSWVRARLMGDAKAGCRTVLERYEGTGPVWSLRQITEETGFKVIVRAAVVSRTFYHHEAYDVRRDAGPTPGPWRVDEISLSEFVHSDPPPPPPPAQPRGTPPA